MEITSYSSFRQNLKSYLDSILKTHAPLFVRRSRGEDVVVMSMDDYEGMQETIYLLSSPKNAERIADALEEYHNHQGATRKLIE
ncbi:MULTISPECIES: type II toxin-antitoxin system Phd/YefM family antitoxin [unclassified Carboxylicivirga]|uniref:type II toxin-antitoxin system Phd/YefM family antitoxin n=1 Tax=Carboxylicivirga TaxID=1628153 RepID=UPI003D350124